MGDWSADTIVSLSEEKDVHGGAYELKKKLQNKTRLVQVINFGLPINLPDAYTGPNARIIFLGHGDPKSTVIASKNSAVVYDPAQLSAKVMAALGTRKIGRVALKACNSAGNARPLTEDQPRVGISQSFAYKFAEISGFATTVTGKMAAIHEFYSSQMGKAFSPHIHMFVKDGVSPKARKLQRGDHVILSPKPTATVANPLPPDVRLLEISSSRYTSMAHMTRGQKGEVKKAIDGLDEYLNLPKDPNYWPQS